LKTKLLFSFSLLGLGLQAAEDFGARLTQLEARKAELRPLIEQSLREIHHLQNSKSNLRYMWETENPTEKSRKDVSRMLELALTSRLDEWKNVHGELDKLYTEREIQDAELDIVKKTRKGEVFFRCPFFPLPRLGEVHRYKMIQDFGLQKDKQTGLSWKTSGWWIGVERLTPVKNCDEGKIVYSGKIPGRGYVVLVHHKHDYLSLYANLDEADTAFLSVGKKLDAGTTLGFVRSKLYFEVRRNGQALEPKKIFSAKQTERLD
jgi:hypothetical protein